MDNFKKYANISYWVIIFFVMSCIFIQGTWSVVNFTREFLHIRYTGIDTVIVTVIWFSIIGYWYRLADRNWELTSLVFEINWRYKILKQIKDKISTEMSGYNLAKLQNMEKLIEQSEKRYVNNRFYFPARGMEDYWLI